MRASSLRSTAVILATLAGGAACNKEPKVDPNQVLPVGADALDLVLYEINLVENARRVG